MCRLFFLLCVGLLASVPAFSLQPPVVLAPSDGSVISGPELTVRWQPLPEGQWCQIQLAADADFSNIIANADKITGTEWRYSALPQDGKRYHWRIRARQLSDNPDEGEGENSVEGESPDPDNPLPGEGEGSPEGEEGTAKPSDKNGGCGSKSATLLKELLGDWLLVGLALMGLGSTAAFRSCR